MKSTNNNPIFIEYYPHTNSDCYKIRNPWTQYASDTRVLCEVKEGLALAKVRAIQFINTNLSESIHLPVKRKIYD
jgi:hypothetical protein